MAKKISKKARRARRNAIQQAWRARPGGREYEARASRKSYWRKRKDYQDGCTCPMCMNLREAHQLADAPRVSPTSGGCGCGG